MSIRPRSRAWHCCSARRRRRRGDPRPGPGHAAPPCRRGLQDTTVPRGPQGRRCDPSTGAAGPQVRPGDRQGHRATSRAGEHVHAHNLGMDAVDHDYEFGTALATSRRPPETRTFEGYRRADGRVGTRNYVGILTSVNCSASTARMIADQFRGPVLERLPARGRGRRAHPRLGLRPGPEQRGRPDPAAHPARLRQPPEHRRRCWCWVWAAR